MFGEKLIRILLVGMACTCVPYSVCGQEGQPAKKIPRINDAARSGEARLAAPQVVTIVHRLNGLKMFRLLARSQEQVEAIASFDETFDLTNDVHTSIIAGLAMDDGRTIAAWLPDAEVEFGPSFFAPVAPSAPQAPHPRLPGPPVAGFPSAAIKSPHFPFTGGMFGAPDLTVITSDGKQLVAEYVGFDGATGLSILRLAAGNLNINTAGKEDGVGEGDNVRVLFPEPAENKHVTRRGLLVRMGTTVGTVLSVRRAPTGGGLARFKVKSARLSEENIGGVAVNESGETLGIVDAVRGAEATILPTGLIRRAARRVLTQRSSVPRPWLGVKGEPVRQLNVEAIRRQGWNPVKAASLFDQQLGIMLTSIAPGSPAANAALRPGDVILKVNDEAVANDDDFSWMLDEAGPSSEVIFTLARPDRMLEEAVRVELSGLRDPMQAFRLATNPATTRVLLSQGIETVALRPAVAARLGASSGLLVVYVDPATAVFESGLRPGDVIESIDGKPIQPGVGFPYASKAFPEKTLFDIVRKKQKLVVTVSAPEKR